jgi:uncharacterized protein
MIDKKQHFVIIDTNVLVSGLISKNLDSPTVKILKFLSESKIIPVYSKEILQEYSDVLHRPKFGLSGQLVELIIKDIQDHGVEITNIPTINEEFVDQKDIVFYAVTISVQHENAILVTGNQKHFPNKQFIVDPAKLINVIEQE